MLRNDNGEALAKTEAKITISIIESQANNTKFSEYFNVFTDDYGRFACNIGTGNYISGNWTEIDWSKDLYLSITTSINGNSDKSSISIINNSPRAIHSQISENLISTSPDGKVWKLKVRATGDLYWEAMNINDNNDDDDDNPNYDTSKWPEELYLVGSFINWDPTNSLKFTKLGSGKFAIRHLLNNKDVIKFIKVQSWNGSLDWSGTSGKVNDKQTLREGGDTPEFEGESGEYMIVVDFKSYTLLIYPL
ncbi:MAG: hypothetical protein PHR45_04440 [Muribaculaceae bacterium]|nr:hypothetical protein [Muribaculaceae bacterium]